MRVGDRVGGGGGGGGEGGGGCHALGVAERGTEDYCTLLEPRSKTYTGGGGGAGGGVVGGAEVPPAPNLALLSLGSSVDQGGSVEEGDVETKNSSTTAHVRSMEEEEEDMKEEEDEDEEEEEEEEEDTGRCPSASAGL